MAKNRSARLKAFVRDTDDQRDKPTPQTKRKLRQDVVMRLLAGGRLRQVHFDAAEEIRAVHEAVGRGMFPTAQTMTWTGRTPSRRKNRDFYDRMTDAERSAWERRYLPWTHEMATEIAVGSTGVRWLQLVIDIVVDNATLREVEARYRLRHGTALPYLARALDRYDLYGRPLPRHHI